MNEEEKIPKKTGYLTNTGRGLQRLETEKLSFLGESQVISKFDSENLAAFAPEEKSEDQERSGVSEDVLLSDQDLLTDVFAARTDTASLDVQNVDSEALKFPSTETIELEDGNESAFNTSGTNSTITTSSGFSTPALAALVAQRVAERSAQNASAIQAGGHPKVTLDFAGIRNYRSMTDIDENSSEDEDSMDSEETHDVGDIAEDMRLEYGPTVDIGKEAERVREALANGIIPDLSIGQQTSVSPNSMMFKQAETQPAQRLEEPATAIEKLKQQGLFAPMTSHAEVDHGIEHIHSLDNLIAPSTMSSYQGNFPTDNHGGLSAEELMGEETISHDPGIREEINQNIVSKKTIVLEGEEPKQQFVPTPQIDDLDLDSRETMPIDCIPPELLSTSPTLKASKTQTVELEPAPRKRSKLESFNPRLAAWIILCSLLFICIVFILYLVGLLTWISPSLDPQHKNVHFKLTSDTVVEEEEFSSEETLDMDALVHLPEAINTASEQVHKAIAFDTWMDSWVEKQINEQTSADARLSALEMGMEIYPNQIEYVQKYIETALEAQKYEEAKAVLETAPETFKNSAEAVKYRYKILQNDPKFMPPETYLTEEMCDEIAPLGGGSTVTLKFKKDGKTIGAFKPNQTLGQSNYRAEIAAWRLCQLLECDFEVPWNRPILVEHALFEKLYARTKSAKKASYRKEMKAIRWQTVTVDKKKKTYVIGTLKDWVPDFTRFPIELTSFWKPWLAQKNFIETYKPLKEALSPLSRNQNTKKLLPEILSNSPDLTTKQLAAQISDVLVFDYLVGNWDRFSGVGSWWGVNCQYKDNHIVSIDNGAAFPKTVNDKVYQRYMMTERFSAHFIRALRNLDKDLTLECLFPNASKYEKEAFELFWKQRGVVLKRIDTLIEKYGEDKVLSL